MYKSQKITIILRVYTSLNEASNTEYMPMDQIQK